MRFILLILFVFTYWSLHSQKNSSGCCDKLWDIPQPFIIEYNADSTKQFLVIVDTLTKLPIYEYNFQTEIPLSNLKSDYYKESISKSSYYFKNFDIDTIHYRLKELIENLDFTYCNDNLRISTNFRVVYLRKNSLETTITGRFNIGMVDYSIVQNFVLVSSCENNLLERNLTIFDTKGKSYSISEYYDPKKRLKFAYNFMGSWGGSSMPTNSYLEKYGKALDIVELESHLMLITYVNKKIKVYDLQSSELLIEIDTKDLIPHKLNALKLNKDAIIFIPEPVRAGGYDMKSHRGIKGNGIDYSNIKDYDDTISKIIVFDRSKNKAYTKNYRIDEIEKIERLEGFHIIFKDGRIDNIKDSFEVIDQ